MVTITKGNMESETYFVILHAKNEKGEEIGVAGILQLSPYKLEIPEELVAANVDTPSSDYIS